MITTTYIDLRQFITAVELCQVSSCFGFRSTWFKSPVADQLNRPKQTKFGSAWKKQRRRGRACPSLSLHRCLRQALLWSQTWPPNAYSLEANCRIYYIHRFRRVKLRLHIVSTRMTSYSLNQRNISKQIFLRKSKSARYARTIFCVLLQSHNNSTCRTTWSQC